MKNRAIILALTLLTIGGLTLGSHIKAMGNLDTIKQYEGNVVKYSTTGEWNYSDIVSEEDEAARASQEAAGEAFEDYTISKDEPLGLQDSDAFSYYMDGTLVKQIYHSAEYICIVEWKNDTVSNIARYRVK